MGGAAMDWQLASTQACLDEVRRLTCADWAKGTTHRSTLEIVQEKASGTLDIIKEDRLAVLNELFQAGCQNQHTPTRGASLWTVFLDRFVRFDGSQISFSALSRRHHDDSSRKQQI